MAAVYLLKRRGDTIKFNSFFVNFLALVSRLASHLWPVAGKMERVTPRKKERKRECGLSWPMEKMKNTVAVTVLATTAAVGGAIAILLDLSFLAFFLLQLSSMTIAFYLMLLLPFLRHSAANRATAEAEEVV